MAVDVASLPPEVQKYIKELREENADRRKSYEVYEKAFSKYDESQQKGLLRMIQLLAEDTEAGAQLFRELADDVLGPPETTKPKEEEEGDDMADKDERPIAEIVAEAVAKALEAQDERYNEAETEAEREEFEKAVAYWDAEAKKLGYEPNTQAAADLFFMANKLGTADLSVAHDQLTKFNEFIGTSSEEEEEEGGEEEEEGEKPKPKFPKAGGKGAGAPQVKEEFDFRDDNAVRERLNAMLDSADS